MWKFDQLWNFEKICSNTNSDLTVEVWELSKASEFGVKDTLLDTDHGVQPAPYFWEKLFKMAVLLYTIKNQSQEHKEIVSC